MNELSFRDQERDVESARSKLAHDLSILRSPKTFSDFSDDLKHEAVDTKNDLIDKAKSAAQSTMNGLVEDIKAKAAANPAAALAIGAGIAWRLFRNPPIATALVGLGLFSLWRTNAVRPPNGYQPDYWEEGKHRLKEQGLDAVAKIKDVAADAKTSVSDKAAEFGQAAKEKLEQWGNDTQDALTNFKSQVQAEVSDAAAAAGRARHNIQNEIKHASTSTYDSAKQFVDKTVTSGAKALADDDVRNTLVLGVAGMAVAAALGIAYQKRIAQSEDA